MRKQEPILAAAFIGAVLALAGCGTETPNAGGGGTPGSTESSSASPSSTTSTQPISTKPSSTHPTSTPAVSHPHSDPQSTDGGKGRIRERCHTGQLSATVTMRNSAAGHRYAWLVLTNTSKTTCTVYGYGGMQLYRSNGRAVPTRMVRDPSIPPRLLILAPGKTARSSLRWTVIPTGGEPQTKACEPTATTAHVTPPDETSYLTVPWRFGVVCDKGTIDQGAYRGTPAKAGS